MPYIPNEKREEISKENGDYLDPIINELAKRIGEIHKSYGYDGAFLGLTNYTVTRLVTRILLDNFDRLRYWHSPAIRGVLQDIGDELYRRVFVPYEDVQIDKNGDVPEYLELKKQIK